MPPAARQPTEPPPGQQPPPQQQDDQHDAAAIAAIAAALAAGTALTGLLALLSGIGVSAIAARAVLALLKGRGDPPAGEGATSRIAERQAWIYRAAYLVAAARRVDEARRRAASSGQSQKAAVRDALKRERRFAQQQRDVEQRRAKAARDVETAARKASGQKAPPAGTLVGWYAHRDDRTTPACAKAHGNNFPYDRPPRISLPGTVHPRCRCAAGPPWPNGGDVDEATAGLEE